MSDARLRELAGVLVKCIGIHALRMDWRSRPPDRIIPEHLAVARISIFSSRLALALVSAALCLGGRTAHAQAAPVAYWMPGGLIGFGGNPIFGQSSNTYGNFAGPGRQ
jgi:hypothetical protein